MGEKITRNGIEIDTDLAEEIKNLILIREHKNARTKALSDSKMAENDKNVLEEKLNAY